MKLNCKPGDLALVVAEPKNAKQPYIGRIVSVLHAAPNGVGFTLPDGYPQAAVIESFPYWVVEWANPVRYPVGIEGQRLTKFGVMPDWALRPIRDPGDDAVDETLLLKPVPFPQLEPA